MSLRLSLGDQTLFEGPVGGLLAAGGGGGGAVVAEGGGGAAKKEKVLRGPQEPKALMEKLADAEDDARWYKKAAMELEYRRWSIDFPRELDQRREISRLKATLLLVRRLAIRSNLYDDNHDLVIFPGQGWSHGSCRHH